MAFNFKKFRIVKPKSLPSLYYEKYIFVIIESLVRKWSKFLQNVFSQWKIGLSMTIYFEICDIKKNAYIYLPKYNSRMKFIIYSFHINNNRTQCWLTIIIYFAIGTRIVICRSRQRKKRSFHFTKCRLSFKCHGRVTSKLHCYLQENNNENRKRRK